MLVLDMFHTHETYFAFLANMKQNAVLKFSHLHNMDGCARYVFQWYDTGCCARYVFQWYGTDSCARYVSLYYKTDGCARYVFHLCETKGCAIYVSYIYEIYGCVSDSLKYLHFLPGKCGCSKVAASLKVYRLIVLERATLFWWLG